MNKRSVKRTLRAAMYIVVALYVAHLYIGGRDAAEQSNDYYRAAAVLHDYRTNFYNNHE